MVNHETMRLSASKPLNAEPITKPPDEASRPMLSQKSLFLGEQTSVNAAIEMARLPPVAPPRTLPIKSRTTDPSAKAVLITA
jgi:hypothetical protein